MAAELNKLAIATHSVVTVGNVSTLLLAENPRRLYAEIVNASDEDMWIKLGGTPAVGDGLFLAKAGFSYEINPLNMWRGAVYGICTSGGKDAAVLECQ